jgi:hypothetical protein
MEVPDLPLDEYRLCTFQLSKRREMAYVALSLVYGTFFPLSTIYPSTSNPFCVKDALALFIIIYSARRHHGGRGLTRAGAMPSLLDKILQDATTYFFVLSTGHTLFLFFEIFTPVSDLPVGLRSADHHQPHIGFD